MLRYAFANLRREIVLRLSVRAIKVHFLFPAGVKCWLVMDVMRFYENVCKLHNCHNFAKNTKCLSLTSQMCRIGYFLVVNSPFIHYVQLCVCRRVRHDHFSYQNRNCNQTGRLTDLPWRRQVNLTSSCKQFFSFFFFFLSANVMW